ncbi:ABC-2 type transport system ATP-binding protein [Granulicella rosea]|uniref:ABC-2 type transport system ATP-binding protein n=1 Tax=Granulicella rosea TaxID=474952 RepID=A0A239IKB4_9BACT|nr:ABC transporter ATP-binding protein [Granulicella rosea]SNS92854.1 ABC-2 type transport system ATP-binding protein [Granulicella rosea]
MTPIVETQRLSKQYRAETALREVSLAIPPGAVYALVGANGAGKSTFIKLLMNIVQPTAGAATVLGFASTEVAGAVFERIGYVSENQEMPEAMTVGDFLAYVRGFYPTWDRALEADLVERLDLPLKRRLKNLSRGMKMKAALASVLAYRPAFIVLDEPFSGLDPLVRDELIESLRERKGESTILLSSHDLEEVESFATHVGYLQDGRLLFSEELSTLGDRFREVTVVVGDGATLPPNLPETWLTPKLADGVFHFVDSSYDEAAGLRTGRFFPQSVDASVAPMNLRSIFVAIARAGRASAREKAEAAR